jgi:hypothetical protein
VQQPDASSAEVSRIGSCLLLAVEVRAPRALDPSGGRRNRHMQGKAGAHGRNRTYDTRFGKQKQSMLRRLASRQSVSSITCTSLHFWPRCYRPPPRPRGTASAVRGGFTRHPRRAGVRGQLEGGGPSQVRSGQGETAAAWEIADKPAVLRRAYLAAPRRATPSLRQLAVPRLAMPSMCDGHAEAYTAAAEKQRWPIRRRRRQTARATLPRLAWGKSAPHARATSRPGFPRLRRTRPVAARRRRRSSRQ